MSDLSASASHQGAGGPSQDGMWSRRSLQTGRKEEKKKKVVNSICGAKILFVKGKKKIEILPLSSLLPKAAGPASFSSFPSFSLSLSDQEEMALSLSLSAREKKEEASSILWKRERKRERKRNYLGVNFREGRKSTYEEGEEGEGRGLDFTDSDREESRGGEGRGKRRTTIRLPPSLLPFLFSIFAAAH